MKRFFFFCFLFFLLATLQLTIHFLPTPGLRIDFPLLLVFYLGFFVPLLPGGIGILLIGLTMEVLAAPAAGVLSLSYLTIFLFLRMVHGHFFLESWFARFLWVLLLTGLQKGMVMILLNSHPNFLVLFLSSLLEALVVPPLFLLLGKLEHLTVGEA